MTQGTIGVVGAGQMGAGIAHVAALAGKRVVLVDVTPDLAGKGLRRTEKTLSRQVEQGKVTSSISITRLAAGTKRPERFIGMHFMNPVPVMALVEVIRGIATSDETTEAVLALAKDLGKTPLLCRDFPGFVANRILMPMLNEAFFAVHEGVATPEAVDGIMKLGMNHPMGPLTLAASVSGPIGWFIPSFMMPSTASGVATPSCTAKNASFSIGMRMRFATKPGKSRHKSGVFPRSFARASTASVVSSEVAIPRITSTSAMTGTGFMKCMPMNRSGLFVPAASRVIEIDDVFVARIVAGGTRASSRANRSLLMASFSTIASTTKPASASRERSAVAVTRASAALQSPAATLPLSTWRARFFSIVFRPLPARSGVMSTSTTLFPASAATCAMPAPICPAPTTPIVAGVIESSSPSRPFARALGPSLSGGGEHEVRLAREGGGERHADPGERREAPEERAEDRKERQESEEKEAGGERRRIAEQEASARGAPRNPPPKRDEDDRKTEDLGGREHREESGADGERGPGREDGQRESREKEHGQNSGRAERGQEREAARHAVRGPENPTGREKEKAEGNDEPREEKEEPKRKDQGR